MKLEKFNDLYNHLLEVQNKGKDTKDKILKKELDMSLGKNMPDLMKLIAEIEPQDLLDFEKSKVMGIKDKKFSMINTIDYISRTNLPLFKAIYCIAYYPNRSHMVDKFTKYRYGQLVPLFLSAFKEHKNIPYEAWNRKITKDTKKNNILLRMAVGKILWEQIKKPTKLFMSFSERIIDRKVYLRRLDKVITYPRINYSYEETEDQEGQTYEKTKTIYLPKYESVINNQLWHANVELRNEYTIKDVWHWDNCPKSFDSEDNSYRKQETKHDRKIKNMKKTVDRRNARRKPEISNAETLFGELI